MLLTLSLFLQSKCIHCKKNLTCHLYQKMGYRRRGFSFFLSPSEANPLCFVPSNPFVAAHKGGRRGKKQAKGELRPLSPLCEATPSSPLATGRGKKLAKGERGGKKLGDNASRCSIYLINSNLCLS